MEKKVPERKVSLREEDVFYIYDKRINKCIKEDCEGTVKYGLVLKVRVSEEESLNCFDCNKCHMKYSPYPNYVRLQKTDMLKIYNQDEVTARDQKRAEDAAKQAAKEAREKKIANRKMASKRADNRSFSDDNRRGQFRNSEQRNANGDRRSYGENKRFEERRPFGERRSYSDHSNRRSFDARNTYSEGRSFGGNRNYEERHASESRRPYGERRQQGEHRSYGEKRDFERKPYQKNSYEAKPKFDRNRDSDGRQSRKSNIIITTGGYQNSYGQSRRGSSENYPKREY